MRFLNSVLSVAACSLLISSCKDVDFKKTKGGMPYKLFASSSGKKIEPGNIIKVNLMQKVKDSVMVNTFATMPVYFPVSPTASRPYDISEVLPTLKQGDSVFATQLMDTFIVHDPSIVQQTPYRKGDKITTTLKVLDVFKSQEDAKKDEDKERMSRLQGEDAAVKAYLNKHNIQAQKVGNGTYVEVLNPGDGPQVTDGKYVTVLYKGSTFGGKVFDTNMEPTFGHTDPMGFVVGSQGMIRGFDEAIHQLRKGSKARFYIPSLLAYGPQAPSPDIKPFEHLIFDVQVLDVADKAPAQPQQMPPPNVNVPQGQQGQGQGQPQGH